MGATLVEKLISERLGRPVRAGEIVKAPVDRLLINDYVGAMIFSKLEQMRCERIVSPERVYLVTDHNLPAFTVQAADKLVLFREKAEQYGISHVTEPGWHGIGHQMMVERFVQPLEIAVGTDSHATMYGGLGAFSCGITVSDAVSILAVGTMWLKVPETIRVRLTGALPKGVTAKDVSLKLLSLFPEPFFTYKAVEITGEAVDELSVEGRLVLANMVAETGAKCAVFEADGKSYAYAGGAPGRRLASDSGAVFAQDTTLDVSGMEPMMACPDRVTNVRRICDIPPRHVDQVFIGSCTNGRMEDLRQAACILRGRRVAKGTRLLITPASQQIMREALSEGVLGALVDAGAMVLPASCASCAGSGPGLIGRGERCVSTTNRNFPGRMGSPDGEVYLASAYAAAAAAVTGSITDPREFLGSSEALL